MYIIDETVFWAKFLWMALRLVIKWIWIYINMLVEANKIKCMYVLDCIDDDEVDRRIDVMNSVAIQEMMAYIEKLTEEDFV